jgi:hypothetical protein
VIRPLHFTVDVRCTAEIAFSTWAERTSAWWPVSHTVTGAAAEVVIEGGVGGRIYERGQGGDEIDWGEVTVWEPPRRLGYLWHMRRDRADATDVEITFVDLGDGTTRVEIVHTGWERLGAEGPPWRERNGRAWTTLLPHYEDACS